MKEVNWKICNDPTPRLEWLQGKASERKVRLFGLACYRRLWHLLPSDRWKILADVCEQFVDKKASRSELDRAWWRVPTVSSDYGEYLVVVANNIGFSAFTSSRAQTLASAAAKAVAGAVGGTLGVEAAKCLPRDAERTVQAILLRDIFGNPFHPIPISPAFLAWHDSTVVQLAQAAYEERHLPEGTLDNGRLAILADALEEAGCTDADILGHLREPGPHVRGCWPVDLCLGKS
jgi:hypothetical protein